MYGLNRWIETYTNVAKAGFAMFHHQSDQVSISATQYLFHSHTPMDPLHSSKTWAPKGISPDGHPVYHYPEAIVVMISTGHHEFT